MKTIQLKGCHKYELTCEITEAINKFTITHTILDEFYICPHSNGCLLLRACGASRGCIMYNDEGIITEVRIYDEYINFGKGGLFRREDKGKIKQEMNKFIGYKIL